jgi:hypothetical protein
MYSIGEMHGDKETGSLVRMKKSRVCKDDTRMRSMLIGVSPEGTLRLGVAG